MTESRTALVNLNLSSKAMISLLGPASAPLPAPGAHAHRSTARRTDFFGRPLSVLSAVKLAIFERKKKEIFFPSFTPPLYSTIFALVLGAHHVDMWIGPYPVQPLANQKIISFRLGLGR